MIELQGSSCCSLDLGPSWSEILIWSSLILLLADVHFCLMSSGFFSFECSECNFAKIALIECSPWASCFLVQKAGGSKNLKIYFSVVGTCSPRAFSGFFSVEKKPEEGSWFVLLWSLSFAGHGWVLYSHEWASSFTFCQESCFWALFAFVALLFCSFPLFLVIFSLVYLWFTINTFFVGCGSALSREILLQFFLHS